MTFNRELFQRQTSRVKALAPKVVTGASSLATTAAKTYLATQFPGVPIPVESFPNPLEVASKLPIKQPIIPLPNIPLPPLSAAELTGALNEKVATGVALAKRASLESISEKLPSFDALKSFSSLSPSNLTSKIPPGIGSALAAAKAGATKAQAVVGQVQSTAASVQAQATSAVQSAVATAQGAVQGAANAAKTAATAQATAAVAVVKNKATTAWKASQT